MEEYCIYILYIYCEKVKPSLTITQKYVIIYVLVYFGKGVVNSG